MTLDELEPPVPQSSSPSPSPSPQPPTLVSEEEEESTPDFVINDKEEEDEENEKSNNVMMNTNDMHSNSNGKEQNNVSGALGPTPLPPREAYPRSTNPFDSSFSSNNSFSSSKEEDAGGGGGGGGGGELQNSNDNDQHGNTSTSTIPIESDQVIESSSAYNTESMKEQQQPPPVSPEHTTTYSINPFKSDPYSPPKQQQTNTTNPFNNHHDDDTTIDNNRRIQQREGEGTEMLLEENETQKEIQILPPLPDQPPPPPPTPPGTPNTMTSSLSSSSGPPLAKSIFRDIDDDEKKHEQQTATIAAIPNMLPPLAPRTTTTTTAATTTTTGKKKKKKRKKKKSSKKTSYREQYTRTNNTNEKQHNQLLGEEEEHHHHDDDHHSQEPIYNYEPSSSSSLPTKKNRNALSNLVSYLVPRKNPEVATTPRELLSSYDTISLPSGVVGAGVGGGMNSDVSNTNSSNLNASVTTVNNGRLYNPNTGVMNSASGEGTTIPQLLMKIRILNVIHVLLVFSFEGWALLGHAVFLRIPQFILGIFLLFFTILLLLFEALRGTPTRTAPSPPPGVGTGSLLQSLRQSIQGSVEGIGGGGGSADVGDRAKAVVDTVLYRVVLVGDRRRQVRHFLQDNFGLLYSCIGRGIFLCMIGGLAWGQEFLLMYLLGTSFVMYGLWTISLRCRFPSLEKAYELDYDAIASSRRDLYADDAVDGSVISWSSITAGSGGETRSLLASSVLSNA